MMTGSSAMGMRTGAETTSTKMSKPMSANMGASPSNPMQMKAKMEAPRSPRYRADYGMQRMNGPQCNEQRAQY